MAVSSGEEEHHWPGYVDALTTMTMMLTFIMCILAIAIFGISQNVSREMVEKMAIAAHVIAGPGKEPTGELAQRIISHLETQPTPLISDARVPQPADNGILEINGRRIASLAPSDSAPDAKVDAKRDDALLTLVFEPRATVLDERAVAEMQEFLNEKDKVHEPGKIEVKAYASVGGAVSDARRVAFYRLMEVRKRLLALGIPADRIDVRVDERKPSSDGNLVQIFSRAPA